MGGWRKPPPLKLAGFTYKTDTLGVGKDGWLGGGGSGRVPGLRLLDVEVLGL